MAAELKSVIARVREWWYGKRVQLGQAITPKVSPKRRVPPNLHMHQTAADLLDWLQAKHGFEYKILRLNDGCVVLACMSDHSVVSSGLCSSTYVAVEQLRQKLEKV